MRVLKFKSMKEQMDGISDYATLDQELIPFWHLVESYGQGEFTCCGQAITEYLCIEKEGKITCPHCVGRIKWYQSIKLK